MLFTLTGIATLKSPEQLRNARVSMLVTPFSIVTLFRLLQAAKASSSITATLLGIVTLIKPVVWNAFLPMIVTLSGIVTATKPDDVKQMFVPVLLHRLILSVEARMAREEPESVLRGLMSGVEVPV